MKKLFFEDVEAGAEIPHEIRVEPTTENLARWAGAVGDFYQVHYDKDFARAVGLPDVLLHGPFKCAMMARFMNEWTGDQQALRKISCRYKGMNFPGETIIWKGRVVKKVLERGENLAECELWAETQDGTVSTVGKATVSLPSKNE